MEKGIFICGQQVSKTNLETNLFIIFSGLKEVFKNEESYRFGRFDHALQILEFLPR